MAGALLPAAANVIFRQGQDVLLIQRSSRAKAWPNFWAFPGGKVENTETFRETVIRETEEEVGVIIDSGAIENEVIIMTRTVQGTKIVYFCVVRSWNGMPEIYEPHLARDMQWFSLDDLPKVMIPHHKKALDALDRGLGYYEFDVAP